MHRSPGTRFYTHILSVLRLSIQCFAEQKDLEAPDIVDLLFVPLRALVFQLMRDTVGPIVVILAL